MNHETDKEEEVRRCEYVGDRYRFGNTVLFANAASPYLFVTKCPDFTLITTADFTPFLEYLPAEGLKYEQRNNWHYVLHVSHGMRLSVTRDALRYRVEGGQIIAYQYSECSIEGNECVYYGMLPTLDSWHRSLEQLRNNLNGDKAEEDASEEAAAITNNTGTHRRCIVASSQIWPRHLFVYMKRMCACDCSPGCSRWSVRLRDSTTDERVCVKNIPWGRLYIMMGDIEDARDGGMSRRLIKETRACPVCAQCYKCSNMPTYCRKHRVCKHKRVRVFGEDGVLRLFVERASGDTETSADKTDRLMSVPRMKRCRHV